jgi:hypothetical protein
MLRLRARTGVDPIVRLERLVDALIVLLRRLDEFLRDLFERVLVCLLRSGLCCGAGGGSGVHFDFGCLCLEDEEV